jgi:hypothetical protein
LKAQTAANALPEAPQPSIASGEKTQATLPRLRTAPRYHLDIQQDEIAQPLSAGQKIKLAAYQDVNGNILIPSLLVAGISHALNSDPKYGTDKGAFGERYGATILRETSQAILSTGVGDAIFHDDPRYYVMGDGHSIKRRVWYAATQVFVTRTDVDGERQRWNAPLLLGYLGAAALTQTYYPPTSQGASVVFRTYGTSLGGAALGFGYHEFLGDALRIAHLKKE